MAHPDETPKKRAGILLARQSLFKNHPCRCLCLGSEEQITRTTPFLFTTLQLRHIFLTEARTFIEHS